MNIPYQVEVGYVEGSQLLYSPIVGRVRVWAVQDDNGDETVITSKGYRLKPGVWSGGWVVKKSDIAGYLNGR